MLIFINLKKGSNHLSKFAVILKKAMIVAL